MSSVNAFLDPNQHFNETADSDCITYSLGDAFVVSPLTRVVNYLCNFLTKCAFAISCAGRYGSRGHFIPPPGCSEAALHCSGSLCVNNPNGDKQVGEKAANLLWIILRGRLVSKFPDPMLEALLMTLRKRWIPSQLLIWPTATPTLVKYV